MIARLWRRVGGEAAGAAWVSGAVKRDKGAPGYAGSLVRAWWAAASGISERGGPWREGRPRGREAGEKPAAASAVSDMHPEEAEEYLEERSEG